MSRESLVFLVGLIVFLVPFTGFPNDWKELVYTVSGGLLLLLGYSLRRTAFLRSIDDGQGGRKSDAFVESVHRHRDLETELETES